MKNIFIIFLMGITTNSQASDPSKRTTPDHLIVMIFDQMRPDYIDRFNLVNFKRLRRMGTNYSNAYVGHLSSETVVSHLVISSGMLPKRLPWQDHILPDNKGLLGKPAANYYVPGLQLEQLMILMQSISKRQFLQQRIKEKLGGSVFTVGEKDYAATVFGSPASDSIITLKKVQGKCIPTGLGVPKYISENERYTIDCAKDYGTANSLYPLDGAHYAPGDDPKHQGGDIWTTDIALEIMHREKWSGAFLTFGAIDKFGHMLGEQDGPRPRNFDSLYSFEEILKIADAQLGRILDDLKEQKLLGRTAIIVTADHGAESTTRYLGNGKKPICGQVDNDHPAEQPFWIDRLLKAGNVAACFEGTAIRLWLKDRSIGNKQKLTRAMSEISGVAEIYELQNGHDSFSYKKTYSALEKETTPFRRWAALHDLELVNTMASPTAPDLVGLLSDGVGFAVLGDHGGAQEKQQRIPFIAYTPGQRPKVEKKPIRLVDIAALTSGIMELN